MVKKPVTLEYPDERPVIPDNYRGVPTLVKDPNGRESVCLASSASRHPPKALHYWEIDAESEPDRAHVEKAPKEFDINMLRCIYCLPPGGLPGGSHLFTRYFLRIWLQSRRDGE